MTAVRCALADVGEAPRHEVAGDEAPTVQRALWRFDREVGGGGGAIG